jgi:hypothetical protein
MRYTKLFFTLYLITMLSGCVTPYQQKGFMGGYTDSRLDSNTVRVSFYGNHHTARETVENDMLYRCAEVTLKDGYDYFVIVSGDTTPTYGSYTTPGTYNQYTNTTLNINGSNGYASSSTQGYYQPGQTIHTRKFESTVMIKMFKGKKPMDFTNAYDAHELIQYMKPQIDLATN